MQSHIENKILLPHHEQQPLCTNRLPYRQGRKLTAIKVYTIASESNHLLIFGVPSLNLRQETKALFVKFGKLLQFNISPQHPAEAFTETYHAHYERIQSARIAKRMLDTRNFYGGLLHVCYAPEMETIDEIRQKLLQRQKDVLYRLRNLKITEQKQKELVNVEVEKKVVKKLNMGEVNTFGLGRETVKRGKRKKAPDNIPKKFKPCFANNNEENNLTNTDNKETTITTDNKTKLCNENKKDSSIVIEKLPVLNFKHKLVDTPVEIVDCTSVDNEVVTNINEHLNYNKFGSEEIREVPRKSVNRIVFNISKKS